VKHHGIEKIDNN